MSQKKFRQLRKLAINDKHYQALKKAYKELTVVDKFNMSVKNYKLK